MVTVSAISFGCWPKSTNCWKSSSTFVILKLPAKAIFLVFQLFWRRKGWHCSIVLPPNVPYLKCPKNNSPVNGRFCFIHSGSFNLVGSFFSNSINLLFICSNTSWSGLVATDLLRLIYLFPTSMSNLILAIPTPSCPLLCCFSINRYILFNAYKEVPYFFW